MPSSIATTPPGPEVYVLTPVNRRATCSCSLKSCTSSPGVAEASQPQHLGSVSEIRIPQSLEEVDNGQILGFGADLAEDHPGYRDQAYKDRRKAIGDLARRHRVGQPIPQLDYTAEELHVWATVLQELKVLYPQHACAEFLRCLPLFNFNGHEVSALDSLRSEFSSVTKAVMPHKSP